jgi:predicted Holliday junction resolvase-like endonuclease
MRDLLVALRNNKHLRGTCPCCGVEFGVAAANPFPIDGEHSKEALKWIEERRGQIAQRKRDLSELRERMTTRAERTSRSVNLGKILEKIVSSFDDFPHEAAECRYLYEPIDYIAFNGLCAGGQVDHISFVDIKSGKARLSPDQRLVKQAVEDGRVELQFCFEKGWRND